MDKQAGITFLLQDLQLFLHRAAFRKNDRSEDGEARSVRVFQYCPDNIADLMLLYFFSRDRRDCLSDTGIKQAQILINLGRGAYRRTRIPRIDFLLDSNSWRDSFDVIAFRFTHASQKLTGIG